MITSTSRPALSSIALDPQQPASETIQLLEREGIRDPAAVREGLGKLLSLPAYPQSPSRVRNLVANLLPDLLAVCEVGRQTSDFFGRFSRLLSAFGATENLLRSLLESPVLRASVLEICLQER